MCYACTVPLILQLTLLPCLHLGLRVWRRKGGGDGEKIYEEEGTLLKMMPAANITLLECNRKSGRYKTRNGTGSN